MCLNQVFECLIRYYFLWIFHILVSLNYYFEHLDTTFHGLLFLYECMKYKALGPMGIHGFKTF